ncbi:flagellar basal body rod protein [Rhodoferax sp. PAMC 29310]|uniref:flagellar basal body rod protein n=1 Tax=Rhodoferax sp. PAMC 29310 TaxID=2822760 RepID=UPI001B332E7D|nr:flagellar basal body rod protein [Rhodoferax sp. PAMC 29310]
MNSISSISVSGMAAAQTRFHTSAHNIANLQTDDFKRQQVEQTAESAGGVSTTLSRAEKSGNALEADVVAQLQAKNEFLANLSVFKTANKMQGALLDVKA